MKILFVKQVEHRVSVLYFIRTLLAERVVGVGLAPHFAESGVCLRVRREHLHHDDCLVRARLQPAQLTHV